MSLNNYLLVILIALIILLTITYTTDYITLPIELPKIFESTSDINSISSSSDIEYEKTKQQILQPPQQVQVYEQQQQQQQQVHEQQQDINNFLIDTNFASIVINKPDSNVTVFRFI